MPTYNENILPSSTGFDLGNLSQRWDAFVQTLDVLGITIKSFESIRFADQFIGGTVTAQLDAALADTGSKVVLVPSTMAAGAPTSIGAGQFVVDLRSGFKIFNHTSVSVAAFSIDDANPSFAAITNGGIVTLPTGARTLVARDTADTLSNKTLTGAASGNSVTLLNFQPPAAAVVGTGSPVTLYSFTIPAGTIPAGKGIRITIAVNHSTGSGTVTYTLTIGGVSWMSYASALTGNVHTEGLLFNNPGSITTQTALNNPVFFETTVTNGGGAGSLSVNTANSLVLALTMTAANTEQVTPGAFVVELIQ